MGKRKKADKTVPVTPEDMLREHLRALGRRGGTARMKSLSAAERSALGRAAIQKRWAATKKKRRSP